MQKAYTIPTLDISDDMQRQVVVDREHGLYIGHPTTALLEDGKTILAVFPKNHGNGQIVLKRSLDGGRTWSERLPVPESWSTGLEVPTIYKVEDKTGKKRLIVFSGLYPIRMSVSEDDGNTWSELKKIGDYGGVVAMGDIEQTAVGEYIAMFHDEGKMIRGGNTVLCEVWGTGIGSERRAKLTYRYWDKEKADWGERQQNWVKTMEKPEDNWEKLYETCWGDLFEDGHFELYQVRSRDGGLTWSAPEMICSHKNGAQLCEPCIIRSPDGKRLVALLRENARKYNSFMIISDNNGDTWSEPIELPAALTGDRHASKYLNDGRLFISFRDTTLISPTKGDWVGWIGTFDDIINLREGQYRVRIMKNYKNGDCGYPGVEVLPDGTVVTTTYGHFTPGEEAYVASVRFHPDELRNFKEISN